MAGRLARMPSHSRHALWTYLVLYSLPVVVKNRFFQHDSRTLNPNEKEFRMSEGQCTSEYDANLHPETKQSLLGQNCLNIFLWDNFVPQLNLRQIEIKHAAPHHAPGKLLTAGAMYTCRVFNNNYSDNVFFVNGLALHHIKTDMFIRISGCPWWDRPSAMCHTHTCMQYSVDPSRRHRNCVTPWRHAINHMSQSESSETSKGVKNQDESNKVMALK